MRRLETSTDRGVAAAGLALGLALLGAGVAFASDEDPIERTHDGLVLVPDSAVKAAWVRPDTDFSVYERVAINKAHVSFRRGWQTDHNRQSVNRVTNRQMQEIKDEAAQMLFDALASELADGGWEVVSELDSNVLLVAPGIVDLDVTAPENRGAGRSFSFTGSAGSGTLVIELFDSVSGEILARAVDQRAAETPGNVMRMQTGAGNRADAQRVFEGWADLLREGLDALRDAGQ